MAVKLGKNAKLVLDSTTIARINNYSVSITGNSVDITELGDDYSSSAIVTNSWSASIEGYSDLDGTTEQGTMHTRLLSGGQLDGLKFYLNQVNYYEADISADAEATIYVENYQATVDKAQTVNFTMTLVGSGPVRYIS